MTQTLRLGSLAIPFTRIGDPDQVLDDVAAAIDLQERLAGRRLKDEQLQLPYWAELWDSSLAVAEFLVNQCGPVKGLRVLDLGCGMGLGGTVAAALGAKVVLADLHAAALLLARLNSADWAPCVRTRRLDWRADRLHEEFDLILGADILYEAGQWQYLERFWKQHLAENGAVLLAEPGRQTGDGFISWIGGRGWETVVLHHPIAGRDVPIRLIWLRRKV